MGFHFLYFEYVLQVQLSELTWGKFIQLALLRLFFTVRMAFFNCTADAKCTALFITLVYVLYLKLLS